MSRDPTSRSTLGEWTIIPEANELRHSSGRRERLEARAMDVLVLLHRRVGSVITVDEILDAVWDGRAVTSHSVAIVVSDLRKALGDDARDPRYIETIPKRGYRLLAAAPPTARPRRSRQVAIWLAAVAGLMVMFAVAGFVLDPAPWSETPASATTASPTETEALELEPTDLERLFLARQLWSRRDHDDVLESLRILSELVEDNPRSARAHSALAIIYAHKSGQHLGLPALDTFREAQRHLDRALALDDELAEAHVGQALLDFFRDHQPEKALSALDRAVSLDPESALAWQSRAMVASALGRHDESLDSLERAATIDPVSASIAWDRVWFLYLAGLPEEGQAAIDQAMEAGGRDWLYEALIADALGDDLRALEIWLERIEGRGFALADPQRILDLATSSSTAAYAELVRQSASLPADHDSPGVQAFWRLESGDTAAAVETLVEAPPSRNHWMILWLHEIPAFDSLRGREEIETLIARTSVIR